jgi:uncharacterized membrane protein YbhN (UPF0104 family)
LKNNHSIWQLLGLVALIVLIVVLFAVFVDLEAVAHELRAANPGYLLAALALCCWPLPPLSG